MGLGLAGIGFAGAIGVGGVAGAVSLAFAGSDLYEAAHNVYLGATGDPDTEAFNPLRDTVFMGNDAACFVAELGAGGWAAFSGSGTSAADDIAERFAQDGHIPDLGHSAADDIAEDGTQTLDCAGINKAREWDYPQDAYEYLRHKDVYDNPVYFDQQTGEVRWPPDDGFVPGTRRNETLEPGTIMTRIGNEDGGYYFSPRETSLLERSLPPFKTSGEIKSYEVIRPLPVESGLIAPTFGEPGGGTQWITEHDVTWLNDNGYITPRR